MPKKVAKEPLLFVDTMFKGCHVEEQSIFMTPQTAPKTIANETYVHTFDSSGKTKTPSTIKDANKIKSSVELDEEDDQEFDFSDYETVNIIVDSIGVDGGYDKDFEVVEDDEISYPLTKFLNDQDKHVKEMVIVEEDYVSTVVGESHVLDETQNELLIFIQEILSQGSVMKSPVVQLIKKNGSVLSGKILNLQNQTVILDNFMDDLQSVSLSEIEGLRILHL